MLKLFLLNVFLWAEEGTHHAAQAHGGHHGSVDIPWGSIFVQAFNFFLLVALLAYLLRKTVKAHFAHRAKDYRNLVERAESAKREAERGHSEIKERLAKLESGATQGLQQARVEAEQMRQKLQQEARVLSERLQQEAKRTTQVELEKAKDELRRELLESALQASSVTLKTSLGSTEQKRLQSEFVQKIQVVGG